MHIEQIEARLLALTQSSCIVYDGVRRHQGELIAVFYPWLNLVECSLILDLYPMSVEFTAPQVKQITGNVITLFPNSSIRILSTIPKG